MRSPFFSVIIPVYNALETLEDCLESVWEQNFSDYEIILVNDGSSDESASWFKSWTQTKVGLRYQLINQPNKGLGAARNRGIREAQGEFCALLDADDIWHPEKLASCHSFLQHDRDTAVLYHRVENFGRQWEGERKTFPLSHIGDLIEKGCPLVPSATILRRETALSHPFITENKYHGAEDLFLWLELLLAGEKFCYWPEAWTYYHEVGGMSTRIEEHLQKVIAVYDYYYQANQISKHDYEKATQRKYYEAARFYQKHGQHHQAHHYYSVADSKSLKILGLRILNKLGINF